MSALLRRLHAREEGVTLPELMIALSVMMVVAGIFLTAVVTVQTNVARQERRSDNNDQARLAIEQLDREVRSGNVIYNPATEALPYYSFRVFTQSNANTSTPPFRCVQWVIAGRELLRRQWPPGQPELASGWRIVAEHIVNRDLTPTEPAFNLDPEVSKGGRTVNVKLAVNGNLTNEPRATIRIQTALTGRNTSLGFSSDVCADLPAEPIP